MGLDLRRGLSQLFANCYCKNCCCKKSGPESSAAPVAFPSKFQKGNISDKKTTCLLALTFVYSKCFRFVIPLSVICPATASDSQVSPDLAYHRNTFLGADLRYVSPKHRFQSSSNLSVIYANKLSRGISLADLQHLCARVRRGLPYYNSKL